MIPTEKVADHLKEALALMETLKGHKVVGFALIIPPNGEPVKFTNLGNSEDQKAFYTFLAHSLAIGQEQSGFGAIRTGR